MTGVFARVPKAPLSFTQKRHDTQTKSESGTKNTRERQKKGGMARRGIANEITLEHRGISAAMLYPCLIPVVPHPLLSPLLPIL